MVARERPGRSRGGQEPDRSKSAADVYECLRSKILGLELKPGVRLVEDDLTQVLDAGRTPVRESLLRLQGEGLVSRRNRGWTVEAVDPMAFRGIFEARIAIEGYATRLAAERISIAALARLEECIVAMEASDKLPRAQLNRLDRTFHSEIVAQSHANFFIEMHARTQFQYWNLRLPIIFLREQIAVSNQHHRELFEALRRRDVDRAEQIARSHIEMTMHIVADALEGT